MKFFLMPALCITGVVSVASCVQPDAKPPGAQAATSAQITAPTNATITAPKQAHTLITAGDIAQCDKAPAAQSAAAKTATLAQRLLATDSKAQVLTLGDNTYPDGAASEFTECYAPTWGQFLARTWPTPGNHDYRTKDASGYYDYFAAAAGPQRRGYYAQQLNGWTILALNSNVSGNAADAQLAFVQQALAQNALGCVLAAWHHPVYTSSIRPPELTMRPVWKLLQEANADVILSAHEHYFEQLAPLTWQGTPDAQNGVASFVVGTGGAKLYVAGAKKEGSEKLITQQHGVMRMHLSPGSAHWEFVNTENEALAQGRIACKPKGRDTKSLM
jgi:acid phosphatase type 7